MPFADMASAAQRFAVKPVLPVASAACQEPRPTVRWRSYPVFFWWRILTIAGAQDARHPDRQVWGGTEVLRCLTSVAINIKAARTNYVVVAAVAPITASAAGSQSGCIRPMTELCPQAHHYCGIHDTRST
jgi:hypothetical protein